MTYALVQSGEISEYPLSRDRIQELVSADPDVETCLPANLDGVDLSEWGIYPVEPTAPPAVSQNEVAEEGPVTGPPWSQSWVVRAMTDDELAAQVPTSVTMRQARLALLGAGILDEVDDAIDGLPDSHRAAAKIEWEYALDVRRDNPLLEMLMPMLGVSSDDADTLFIEASKL